MQYKLEKPKHNVMLLNEKVFNSTSQILLTFIRQKQQKRVAIKVNGCCKNVRERLQRTRAEREP